MSSAQELIEQNRHQLLLSGEITEFHERNLTAWPHVLFSNIKDLSVEFDFQLDENSDMSNPLGIHAGNITYYFTFKPKSKIPEDYNLRLSTLEGWVRSIFWKEKRVIFKKRGKQWNYKK